MKYMTFNSACAFAGVANLLSLHGVEAEDRDIALGMQLPWMLEYNQAEDAFAAGPMLQSADWFDLYLRPRGFRLVEREFAKEQVPEQLTQATMLGLLVTERSRHAVIFQKKVRETYHFLNNKWQQSPEPETLELTGEELLSRLTERVMLGKLEACEPKTVNFQPLLERSFENWALLGKRVEAFAVTEQSVEAQLKAMNALFRPLLLDGLTMMELLGDAGQTALLRQLQGQYLKAAARREPLILGRELDLKQIAQAVEGFRGHILKALSHQE